MNRFASLDFSVVFCRWLGNQILQARRWNKREDDLQLGFYFIRWFGINKSYKQEDGTSEKRTCCEGFVFFRWSDFASEKLEQARKKSATIWNQICKREDLELARKGLQRVFFLLVGFLGHQKLREDRNKQYVGFPGIFFLLGWMLDQVRQARRWNKRENDLQRGLFFLT